MKEIHAYQNDDGTYSIEIKDSFGDIVTITRVTPCENIHEGIIKIPKAKI